MIPVALNTVLRNVVSQVKEIMSLEPKGFPRQIVYLLLEISGGLRKNKALPYHNIPRKKMGQILVESLEKHQGETGPVEFSTGCESEILSLKTTIKETPYTHYFNFQHV